MKSAPRRPAAITASLFAFVLVVSGLTVVGAAPAGATTSSSSKVMTALNKHRAVTSASAFLRNGFLDDYSKGKASNYADCGGCANPHDPTIDLGPSEVNRIFVLAKAKSKSSSQRLNSIIASLTKSANDNNLVGGYNYAGVGYVTKGTTSYAVVTTALYSSAPLAKMTTGTVSIPKSPIVGQTLKPTIKGFSPTPTSYTYSWMAGGVSIGGQPTQAVPRGDLGFTVTLTVTAHHAGYRDVSVTAAKSKKIVAAKLPAGKLSVLGNNNVGANRGWSLYLGAPSGTTQTYQWLRNGKKIAGATVSGYQEQPADLGKVINLRITVSLYGYQNRTITSKNTKKTKGRLFTTALPITIGAGHVGAQLVAHPGSWLPATGTFSYQWKLNGKSVHGATASTFTLGASAANKKVSLTVTDKKSGYVTASRTSNAFTVDEGAFISVPIPTISGTLAAGHKLTVEPGTWNPTATSYSYQWVVGGLNVTNANKSTFTPTTAEKGKTIWVVVVGHRDGYQSVQRDSSLYTLAS